MASNTESKSQYLSLALNARGAMDSLRSVTAGSEITGRVTESLQRFLSILLLHDQASFAAHLQEHGSPASFEEVAAFEEILPYFSHTDLANAFRSVLNSEPAGDRKGGATTIVKFLGAVESKALQRFSDSMQAQPY